VHDPLRSLRPRRRLVSACSAPRIAVEPRVSQPDVSGHVAAAQPGQPLQPNDVEGALDLGDDTAPGLRADLDLGSPHFVLAGAAPSTTVTAR